MSTPFVSPASPAQPSAARRVLLCAIGMSPQIVTETLYALAIKPAEGVAPWVPTEVHIVTTARGADNAKLNLLSGTPGWFHQLRHDYGLPAMHFEAENMHVIRDAQGRVLDDIRTPQDNEAAADLISELVRGFTADPDCALHASLAGGRKTMSYYLGYALSLYGRPQDRLSHVLVSDPFESHPDFYYPTPQERVIHSRAPLPPQAMNCADAVVQLAQVPFVRLRDGLPERLLEGRSKFSLTVEAANRALEPAQVTIRLQARQVLVNGEVIPFGSSAYAFYVWLARRAQDADQPEVDLRSIDDAREFRDAARVLLGSGQTDYERIENALKASINQEDGEGVASYFQPLISRDIHDKLRKTLGNALAERVKIINSGSRGKSRYRLPPDLEITLLDRE